MAKEPHPDDAVTVETPLVEAPPVRPPVDKRVVRPDDVTQTVPMPKADPAADPAAETSVLPAVDASGAADETAVLPPVRPSGTDGAESRRGGAEGRGPASSGQQAYSAVRPTARRPEEDPADRVPRGIFRDSGDDVTRELPVLGEEGRPGRPRPSWAEETPLDDLPTLADELLGPRRDREDGEDGEDGPRRR
ncbi:hypothetical protein [Streptomyces sp. NPDC007369]|uniref:hypothetical protein n=1 Tax=Streptomyces sp. NPDC007369 TaxID=3154589 RepID=UPI0033DC5631